MQVQQACAQLISFPHRAGCRWHGRGPHNWITSVVARGSSFATPGRLEDFIGRKLVKLNQVEILVLGRSGSHARHGLQTSHPAHRCGHSPGASDALLLGNARGRSARSSRRLPEEPGTR